MLPSIELRLAAIPGPPGLGQSCRRTRRRRVLRVRATVRRISNLEKCVAELDDRYKGPVGHAKSVTTDGLNTPPKDLLDHSAVPAAVIRHPETDNLLSIPPFPFAAKPPETCDAEYATVQSLCDHSDEVDVKVGKLSERLLIANCALDRCKRDVQTGAKRISYLEDALNLCITGQAVNAMNDTCVANINEINDKLVTLSNTVSTCATADAVADVVQVATDTTLEAVFEEIDKLAQTNIATLFAQQADLFHHQLLTELKTELKNMSLQSVPTIRQDSKSILSQDPESEIDKLTRRLQNVANWSKGKVVDLETSIHDLCEGLATLDTEVDAKIDQKLDEFRADLQFEIDEKIDVQLEAFDKKIDSKVTNKLERKIDAKLAPKAIEDRLVKRVQGTVMTVLDKHLNFIVEQRVRDVLSSR